MIKLHNLCFDNLASLNLWLAQSNDYRLYLMASSGIFVPLSITNMDTKMLNEAGMTWCYERRRYEPKDQK